MKRITPTEEQDHIAIVQWSKTVPILRDYLIHIPNERKCSVVTGRKFKAMGVRKGVSDFLLPYPNNGYNGLWLELKRKGLSIKCVSAEQYDWMMKAKRARYHSVVAFGFDEAVAIFKEYLRGI